MTETATRKALGRGLSALLDDMEDEERVTAPLSPPVSPGGAQKISIDLISSNSDQPRKYFDDAELNDLTESIRQKGVIQPILVRPMADRDGHYEIVAGERRWRAAQRAKLHEIPAVVREMDDAGALEVAIIENVQRADLNPMEEAYGYRALMDRFGYTQETLAKNIGKSRSHIANIMRLSNLPQKVQDLVRTGEISAGHGRALVTAPDPEALAERIIRKGLSVRQAEKLSKGDLSGGGESPGGPPRKKDADTRALEGILSVALRMPVTIKHLGKEGGEVRIAYRNLEDLEELAKMLQGQGEPLLAGGN